MDAVIIINMLFIGYVVLFSIARIPRAILVFAALIVTLAYGLVFVLAFHRTLTIASSFVYFVFLVRLVDCLFNGFK